VRRVSDARSPELVRRDAADGEYAPAPGKLTEEAAARLDLGPGRAPVRARATGQVRVSRHGVPEENLLLELELGENAVKDRRRGFAGPAPGELALRGEGNSAHARPAVAGRLADEEDRCVPALCQVAEQAVPQKRRACSVPVEVEGRSDPNLPEGLYEPAGWSQGNPPGRHEARSLDRVIRRRLVVHGYVQGVFFRDTMRRLAEEHGVVGWVRNNRDGTVEAVLEGQAHAVEKLLAFARKGPRGAQVEHVEVGEEEPEGLRGFAVR
jgi:acylphosphatase